MHKYRTSNLLNTFHKNLKTSDIYHKLLIPTFILDFKQSKACLKQLEQ